MWLIDDQQSHDELAHGQLISPKMVGLLHWEDTGSRNVGLEYVELGT